MRKAALVFAILIVIVAALTLWIRRDLSRAYRGFSAAQVFVEIPRGTSRWSIASLLQRNGVIHSKLAFLVVSERHRRHALKAGEYLFTQAQTPEQVFDQIAGGHIYVHVVVVPEGWTMFDIAAELERQKLCTRNEFLIVAQNPSLVRNIAPQAKSLEGFLFPSTYEFSRNTSPEEMAETMVHEFESEWNKIQSSAQDSPVERPVSTGVGLKGQAASPLPLSPIEIVTLASLIERETPQPQERPIVSSVFYNRLGLRLPLQCDPTVQYALDLAGKPTAKVSAEDLRTPSPYNTYLHRGLPPGPIANPGDASLRAALHPARTQYLYFVANDSGGHFFSRTLAEHNRNVEKYRRLLQGLPAVPAPPPHARKRPVQQHPRHITRSKSHDSLRRKATGHP